MFVQEGAAREPRQAAFVSEVQDWQKGHFRAGFATPEQLRDAITGALHEWQLANAAGPLNAAAMRDAALSLLPPARQRNGFGSPMLNVAVAGGPSQRVLRAAELEALALLKELHKQALFGEPPIFDSSERMDGGMRGSALVLEQGSGQRIQLDEQGSILLQLPLESPERRSGFGLFALIEETVMRQLSAAIAYAAWLLEAVDPKHRITHVAVAASIDASEHLGWRTQAEQDASPKSATMRMGGADDPSPICVDRPRAALRHDAQHLAEDLMVPLRRARNGKSR